MAKLQGLVVEQNCLDIAFKCACNYLKLSSIDKEKMNLGLKSKFLVNEDLKCWNYQNYIAKKGMLLLLEQILK